MNLDCEADCEAIYLELDAQADHELHTIVELREISMKLLQILLPRARFNAIELINCHQI